MAPSGSHIQNLFVCSCFSCSLSSLFSLSALHPVMDQRTCPKVLYRQHTCSMSLHADVTLQLQPCTVDMCVCLHRWCEAPLVVDVWPYKQQCVNISNCIDLEANVSDCERKYITSCSLYISYFEINSTFFYCILSSQLWPDAFMCLSICFLSTQHLRKFTVLTRTLSWTQCVCWINQEPL